MFEWLEQEISSIKTPKFHLVDGPVDSRMRDAILQASLSGLGAYKEFVLKFGNAKLYRGSRSGYCIVVFAAPRESSLDDGSRLYHLGSHDGAKVYVKPAKDSSELPIFEFEDGNEERVAGDFGEWLTESCARARKQYSNAEWAAIVLGPEPFSAAETEIIAARRLIRWKVTGIDSDGNHMFEVSNSSQLTLPALTLGVRSKDQRLNGAVYLKIGHVAPGQAAVIHADCYKKFVPPNEIEVFSFPDPQPEDRDYYFELRK